MPPSHCRSSPKVHDPAEPSGPAPDGYGDGMGKAVVSGALLQCSFGAAPSSLGVLPANRVKVESQPAANVGDSIPYVNIKPFGVCSSLANPITAAQTAAALGALTPGTCTPVTTAPWFPGAIRAKVAKKPALTDSSVCTCAYGGVIKINVPMSFRTTFD